MNPIVDWRHGFEYIPCAIDVPLLKTSWLEVSVKKLVL